MLKSLLWFLLLANAGLFALQRGYLDPFLPDQHDPQRLQQQLAPERMRLLSLEAVTAPVVIAEPAVAPETLACVELGEFSEAEASRFEAGFVALALGGSPTRRRLADEASSHLVFIPSQGDKVGAERKSAELRRLGVADFYVLQAPGKRQFGISLGVFRTRAAADVHLSELEARGVRSARVGAFGSADPKIAIQLHALDQSSVNAAVQLATTLAKVKQRECAAQ
ncbi:SPOR domain-containing protein [Actimicrobium sp. CCI2.3]|uniref:SPOR domain-containing protein n=1 Tax=Actimicrobium sp. CCI2.3 TaxID=3048616 RepID=UPI002AB3960E|nr:SPOR domain-containing protein [Actimicrobium sp. CCI2.3]MDY7576633.1 SPOR domain-containing protein [Actimicrobium sp. CCI2.3]MEB0021234.1 SPOR domain-containing protein [Actimicrobium sp. CCI2.3]